MRQWAFICTSGEDGHAAIVDTAGTPTCRLTTVGVADPADACGVVDRLIVDGVELIEQCGAFGAAETAAVLGSDAGRVPVGAVTYPASEAGGLHRLFG